MSETAPPPIGDNRPPLRETAKLDIEEQLAPLAARKAELLASLAKATCTNPDEAGKCADLAKQFKKLWTKGDNVRKDTGEPYTEAVAAVNSTAKAFLAPLVEGPVTLKNMVDKFDKDQRAIAERERQRLETLRREQLQREAEERERQRELDAAAEARAAEAGVKLVARPEPAPEPELAPPPPVVEAPPIASGDYGGSAHRRVRKVAQITDVYALPPEVLNAPKVTDAILSVVRAMRTGNPDIEIRGIEVVDDHGVVFR